ncbi:hypothetical protein ACX0G7_10495 [Flavitalea antarctica]
MSHGKPISKETADKEINKFKDLTEPVNRVIAKILTVYSADPDRLTYYSSASNAFLFDRKTVQRFFHDKRDGESGDCEYLLVILGAHHVAEHGAQIGAPTVILAGVNQDPQDPLGQTYKTLEIAAPATEYPTGKAIVELPLANSSGFKVKIL